MKKYLCRKVRPLTAMGGEIKNETDSITYMDIEKLQNIANFAVF